MTSQEALLFGSEVKNVDTFLYPDHATVSFFVSLSIIAGVARCLRSAVAMTTGCFTTWSRRPHYQTRLCTSCFMFVVVCCRPVSSDEIPKIDKHMSEKFV